MLAKLTGFISPYLLPVAGVAIVALSLLSYTSHLRLKAAKSDLAAKETVITALSAENKNFADLVARKDAQHAAELAALKSLQPRIIERVRVVERAKQEVRQNASQGDLTSCAPGVSSVVERLHEYEAERSLSAGGGGEKAAPRAIDMPANTRFPGSD